MAFSRYNIEKRRFIELVRQNPILWDCRLPHYKRSDKNKAIKWNELGRMFNVNGERVQRTFTSLREIFRRELNHEKMLEAQRFTSKWEYYDAMAFLKEVIRERKSRERIKHESTSGETSNNNNNNNNSMSAVTTTITAICYLKHKLSSAISQNAPGATTAIATATCNNSSSINNNSSSNNFCNALQLQPDVTLTSLKPTSTTTPITTTTATTTPTAASPTQVLLSCSRSCSSSPSIYIKDEPDDSHDDECSFFDFGGKGQI
ncbi:GATA zinc finger domain-containing protein 18-like [Drosophila tropicalis]|uniref:GATA zinc finger domain-containing protein 18-like n=1 Tax=Drosophila tropicalis TaxID=46794 RepID=UPI0035ABDA09